MTCTLQPYLHINRGRTPKAAVIVAAIWGAVLLAIWLIDMAPWIAAILALFTLPALSDLIRDPRAGVQIENDTLGWFRGDKTHSVPFAQIEKIRFDTRLDFSAKVTVVIAGPRKLRLPQDCLPPHHDFEKRLQKLGLKTERHQFGFQ